MNRRVIRTAAVLAAALLVGAVGFAVANAVVEPPVSQIPTVVTVTGGARASQFITATVAAPLPATTATQPTSAKPAKAAATHDEREVVKPSMRDDGDNDGDDNGSKPSDHDKDDHSSTGKTSTAAVQAPGNGDSTHAASGGSGSDGSSGSAPSTAHVQAAGHASAVQRASVVARVTAPAHTSAGVRVTADRRTGSAGASDRGGSSSGKNTGGTSH